MLPFGLRSATNFNAVVDALEWHLCHQGIEHVFNYLDDFIMVGAPGTAQCAEVVGILNRGSEFLYCVYTRAIIPGTVRCSARYGTLFTLFRAIPLFRQIKGVERR